MRNDLDNVLACALSNRSLSTSTANVFTGVEDMSYRLIIVMRKIFNYNTRIYRLIHYKCHSIVIHPYCIHYYNIVQT